MELGDGVQPQEYVKPHLMLGNHELLNTVRSARRRLAEVGPGRARAEGDFERVALPHVVEHVLVGVNDDVVGLTVPLRNEGFANGQGRAATATPMSFETCW
jgi:hypothetical protein